VASGRDIRAGRTYVTMSLRAGPLYKGLRDASRRIKTLGTEITQLGAKIGGVGLGVATPLLLTTKAAGDAQESLSRFRAVFGDQAAAAEDFADRTASAVGRSSVAIKSTLSDFQGLTVGLGFDPAEARELSQTLTNLSLDFASFNNLADADAAGRFISALTGSSEVLARFGVDVKQAAVNAELLRQGVSRPVDASEQEKAVARLAIITRSLGKQGAIGDAVRTSGSYANQIKRLGDAFFDLKVAVGSAVIPVITPLVRKLGELAKASQLFVGENKEFIATTFRTAAAAAAAGGGLIALGVSLKGLAAGFAAAAAAVGLITSPLGLVAVAVGGVSLAFARLTETGRNTVSTILASFRGLRQSVSGVLKDVGNALAAGDLTLAANVLGASLKLAFTKSRIALEEIWIGAKEAITRTFSAAFFGVSRLAATAVRDVSVSFALLKSGVGAVADDLRSRFTESFALVVFLAESTGAKIKGILDDSFDVDKALADAGEQLRSVVSRSSRQSRDSSNARNQAFEQNVLAADAKLANTLSQLSEQQQAGRITREDAAAERLKALDNELATATQALAAFRKSAREAAAEGRERGKPDGGDGGSAIAQSLEQLIAKLRPAELPAAELALNVRQSVGVVDTRALQSLVGGPGQTDHARQTAEATKRSAELLHEVVARDTLRY
jgi:hypothetical protein